MVQITIKKEYSEQEWAKFYKKQWNETYNDIYATFRHDQRLQHWVKVVTRFERECAPQVIGTLLRLRAGYLSCTWIKVEAPPMMKTNITTIAPGITNTYPSFWDAPDLKTAEEMYNRYKDIAAVGSIIRINNDKEENMDHIRFVIKEGITQTWYRQRLMGIDAWIIYKHK